MNTHDEFLRVKGLLDENGLDPKRAFGQNFLIDKDVIDKIVGFFPVESFDCVVEIGPGLGALTIPLAKRARKLIAVEADKDMTRVLTKVLAGQANVSLVNEPFEHWDGKGLEGKILLLGNLPYNLTTRLLECATKIKAAAMGFMVQKEVANRLSYIVGNKDNGALSCYLALLGDVQTLVEAPKGCFYPIPKVDSAFVTLKLQNIVPFDIYKGLKYLFLTPNKKLENVLANLVEEDKATGLKAKYPKLMAERARQVNPVELAPLAADVIAMIAK